MSEPVAERGPILRAAVGLGLYAGAFGMAYGAVAVGSGLSAGQSMVLSLVMFSGASQFAFVGAVAAGSPFAGVAAALLLGVRNAFYGVPMSAVLAPRGGHRLWTAHFVIDETTAMAVGQPTRPAQRYAFWSTGLILFALWQLGSLAGSLVGAAIDPADFGLEAAAALVLVPLAPPGVPVLAAAGVALVAGLGPDREPVG